MKNRPAPPFFDLDFLVPPRQIAVIVSSYNASITDRLRDGAVKAISARWGSGKAEVVRSPGSFELCALALAAAECDRFAGIVALGCLIHGETMHDRHIAAAVAHGLVEVTLKTGLPVAFGVITAETTEQAKARAGGAKGNKGVEAAEAVMDTVEAMEAMRRGPARASRPRALPDKARTLKKKTSKGMGN